MQEYECNILEQYDMDIRSTRKIRGAVLCDTEQGLYLLKEVSVSSDRVQALAELYNYIEKQEWCEVDKIVENREGDYVSCLDNGNRYILKKWFQGRECDTKKPGELLEAVSALAKLHLLMRKKIDSPVASSESVFEEYQKHNRELKKVRSYVRRTSPKSDFELEFLKSFDEMYLWAETAKSKLAESDYENLRQESKEGNCLVHGEYNYHNILMSNAEGRNRLLAITSFDKFKQGIQVEDFYYFLRKVMEKYGWKERLGDSMLNAYSAVKPLSASEVEYLKIRLVYPEKFWKVANAYYYSNKSWMSVKNVEKLGISIRQTKEKERFLKNVFSFNI